MKKKNKNQARKSITAVGAVVAAGLTPGIVTGTPAQESLSTDIKLTAADVVSINGDVYEFEDLFAMNQGNQDPVDQLVVLYGSPNAMKDLKKKQKKEEDKKKKEEKSKKAKGQDITDSLYNEIQILEDEIDDLREQTRLEAMRQDRLQRALQDRYKLVYGPPRPRFTLDSPESLRRIISADKMEATNLVQNRIIGIAYQITQKSDIYPEDNIIRDLKLDSQQLKTFSQEIEESLGVSLTNDMMKKLGSLKSIANFIVEVATPIDEED